MFSVPAFVPPSVVRRAGNPDPASELSLNNINARVQILKEIRTLEKKVEIHYQSISMRAKRVLDDMVQDQDEWSEVSTKEVAEAIGGRTTLDYLCVHKYLMHDQDRFVAFPIDFLSSQRFLVRPKAQVDDLRRVSGLVVRRDPAIGKFVEKAKQLVEAYRARHRTSVTSSAAPSSTVDTTQSFTSDEQAIIRVLSAFVRANRSTQQDPYVTCVSAIMKQIGLYGDLVEVAVVHAFLTEMGALAPWDEPSVRGRKLFTVAPKVPPAVPSGSVLSPEEYYPKDPVEHVRHDFGDLPAYVIDDASAEELDDAISLERIPLEPDRYWIHVHVADPTASIHPNHVLAQQARIKYQTAYDIQGTDPMIPSSVMYEGLSLGSRSKRGLPENVLTFSFKVNEVGDIVDWKVRAGIVRNIQTLTYDRVNEILGVPQSRILYPFERGTPAPATSPPSIPVLPAQAEDLRTLYNLTLKMIVLRCLESDSFYFTIPAAEVSMTSKSLPPNPTDYTHPTLFEGFPELRYGVWHGEEIDVGARRLVAECMKAAGRVASRFHLKHGLPGIRRAITRPQDVAPAVWDELMSIRALDGYISSVDTLRLGVMMPAGEDTLEPKGHFSLGIPDGEGYMRVTSPLRRFGDMVAHWQIKHVLAAGGAPVKPLFDEAWMNDFRRESSLKAYAMKTVENRNQLFWSLKFIERWMANPQNAEHADLLQRMDAIVIRDGLLDTKRRRVVTNVKLLGLGVTAKLIQATTAPQPSIGTRVLVNYSGLKLGAGPELFVTLA